MTKGTSLPAAAAASAIVCRRVCMQGWFLRVAAITVARRSIRALVSKDQGSRRCKGFAQQLDLGCILPPWGALFCFVGEKAGRSVTCSFGPSGSQTSTGRPCRCFRIAISPSTPRCSYLYRRRLHLPAPRCLHFASCPHGTQRLSSSRPQWLVSSHRTPRLHWPMPCIRANGRRASHAIWHRFQRFEGGRR